MSRLEQIVPWKFHEEVAGSRRIFNFENEISVYYKFIYSNRDKVISFFIEAKD